MADAAAARSRDALSDPCRHQPSVGGSRTMASRAPRCPDPKGDQRDARKRGMSMRYLRNLIRRPVRTALTIVGITIGIWALVVFGSMANKINALVAGGSGYYADKITVADASGQLGGFASAPISLTTADKIRAVEGVAVVDS